MVSLCLPNPYDYFHVVDEIDPLVHSVQTFSSRFHSQEKPAQDNPMDTTQSVTPPNHPGMVANLPHNNQIPQVDPTQKLFFRGTVETEYGDVSSNDEIKLRSLSQNKSYTTFSDIRGQFLFEGIEPATDYRLTVVPKGMFKHFVAEEVNVISDQVAAPIMLLALPVDTLNGVIVNSEGFAVPHFGIKTRSRVKLRWGGANIVTDLIGQFQVENVPVGALEFSSMAGQLLTITGHNFEGDLQTPLTLVVDEGPHELNGLVFDHFNNPASGVNVNLQWIKIEGKIRSIVNRHTTTNPLGYFSMKGIGSGEHDLVLATTTGVTHRQTVNIRNDTTDLTIVLSQASVLY